MTLRDASAAAIKLLGLYFASRVVSLYSALMLTPYLLSPAAFSPDDPALATSVAAAVGNLAVALIAIFGADRIAILLFPATPLTGAVTRQDLLSVGIALLGLWICVDAAVAMLRAAGAVVFYWRAQVPAASLERAWPQTLANIVALGGGFAVARFAQRLAARLDAR